MEADDFNIGLGLYFVILKNFVGNIELSPGYLFIFFKQLLSGPRDFLKNGHNLRITRSWYSLP